MDVLELLKYHEGFRGSPYFDTRGFVTVGYGHNLDANPLTPEQAEAILVLDVAEVRRQLGKAAPWASGLDRVRLAALEDMAFQLGVRGLSGFRRMLAALKAGDMRTAEAEALDSQWAHNHPERATRIARMLRTGNWPTMPRG
jgi:lysozyme